MSKSATTQATWANRLLIWVVILFVLTLIARIVLICFHNANYGGLDMNVVYGIQRILLGEPLYQDPALPTYAIVQYSPLFYYVAAGTARLLHTSGNEVQHVYMIARSLNLLFNLATVSLTAAIIRLWDFPARRVWTFALPALMIVTLEYFTRGDSLHLAFFAAAMYATLHYLQKGKTLSIILAGVAVGCCIMSKQSGILSAGIIGCCLLFTERKYALAVLFSIVSILSAALIAWVCAQGDWLAFYQNAYLGLKNGIGWDWLYTIFISQFYYDLIPCYLLGGIIAWYGARYEPDKKYRFIATGTAMSFVFALVTGLKIGSGNNYFTEFLFFILCGLPRLLAGHYGSRPLLRFGKYIITVRRFAVIAFFILISSKTMGLVSAVFVERWIRDRKEVYAAEQQLFRYFRDTLALKKGEYIYFSKREFLDNIFIGYSLMPTKDVTHQVYSSNPSTYDYSRFIAGMNSGFVTYIVTPADDRALNTKDEEVPFVHFQEDKFRWIGDVAGHAIFRYSGL